MLSLKTSKPERKIRVLITKVGLDGHDRGAKVVAALLREAGMEVIYLGCFQTPEGIVRAALEESVDVVGVSTLSGEHLFFLPQIYRLLQKSNLSDLLLIAGGVIPYPDIPELKKSGVKEVFPSGTPLQAVVDFISKNVSSSPPSKTRGLIEGED